MKAKVVYLTADADTEITALEEGQTYIIGGIVDHNRYKNLCLNKAKEQDISTARLPIGTYLAGESRRFYASMLCELTGGAHRDEDQKGARRISKGKTC